MSGQLSVRLWASEIEITGDSTALASFARAIDENLAEMKVELFEAGIGDSAINSSASLRVEDAVGKVLLTREGSALIVRGQSNFRKLLADEIDRFARGEIAGGSTHIHVEPYPGHFYLAPDSVPLVVERIPSH